MLKVNQDFAHIPLSFIESFISQTSTTWQSPYTFSGKEKDDETGYSYFGARYYDSDLSIWLSVDPLAFKYPHESPYSYVGNRPINTIDPWGMDKVEDPNGNTGEAGDYKQTSDKKFLYGDGLKTKVWDPNYDGMGNRAGGPDQKGGYVDYEGGDVDFENYNNSKQTMIKILITNPTAINDVGHTAIQIGSSVYGYYPSDENNNRGYDCTELMYSIGEMEKIDRNEFDIKYLSQGYTEYNIQISLSLAYSIEQDMKNRKSTPGNYSLLGTQCTSIIINSMIKNGVILKVPMISHDGSRLSYSPLTNGNLTSPSGFGYLLDHRGNSIQVLFKRKYGGD